MGGFAGGGESNSARKVHDMKLQSEEVIVSGKTLEDKAEGVVVSLLY